MSKEALKAAIEEAKKNLAAAEQALEDFIALPQNNVFASLDDACAELEDRLRGQASQDCEGSYNCGADEYVQQFIVDEILYEGKLTVDLIATTKLTTTSMAPNSAIPWWIATMFKLALQQHNAYTISACSKIHSP